AGAAACWLVRPVVWPRVRFQVDAVSRWAVQAEPEATIAAKPAHSWAAEWFQAELTRSPVLLFTQSDDITAARALKEALREAFVKFEVIEVDRLGAMSTEVMSVLAGLPFMAFKVSPYRRQPELPLLFVGGVLQPEDLLEKGKLWLQQTCYQADAQFIKPDEGTNMTWTMRTGARWLPPKNINGRRWYQDDADMASTPDEHADSVRIEYNKMAAGPGAGSGSRGKLSGPAAWLMRQETNLDKLDKNGKANPYPEFKDTALMLRNDRGISDYLRSRDLNSWKKVDNEKASAMGLPK
ncbi:unnamed protein product, partial [Polarella glacialis]